MWTYATRALQRTVYSEASLNSSSLSTTLHTWLAVDRPQRLHAIPAEGHRPHPHVAGCDAGPVRDRRQLPEEAGERAQEHAPSLHHVPARHRGEQSRNDGAASR